MAPLDRDPSSATYYGLVKCRGRQIRQSLRTDNLVEARRKLRDFRGSVERTDPNAGRVTVEVVLDRYLATCQAQEPGTLATKVRIAKATRRKWGGAVARTLRKSEILAWIASHKFGVVSRNKYLRFLRAAFQMAVDDRILADHPLAGVKEEKVPKPIRLTPTREQFKAIVTSIRTEPQADTREESSDYAEFMGLAGLGQAETTALKWQDVDREKGHMICFRRKTKEGFAVPIYPWLRPLLERRYVQAVAANGGLPPPPEMKVFTVQNPKKAVEAACRRLGLPNFTPRSFRRFFITTAIERGVDVGVIASWQAHRDGGRLLLSTYAHVRPAHSLAMARLMT